MKALAFILILMSSFSTLAEGKVHVQATFKSANGTPAQITWDDLSVTDWAGHVMIARLNVQSNVEGTVSGVVKFTLTSEDNLSAVALKQSFGGEELIVKGAFDDFTDVEGRRIISLIRGQALEIEMPISEVYKSVDQKQSFHYMIELEAAEYF